MRSFIKYKNDYLVSSEGEIWKIENGNLKLKKQTKDSYGYLMTSINGKYKLVHRVIMEAFRGSSKLTVDHLDKDRANNKLANLEYVTLKENVIRGQGSKITWNNKNFRSFGELASYVGMDTSNVHKYFVNDRELNGHKIKKEDW